MNFLFGWNTSNSFASVSTTVSPNLSFGGFDSPASEGLEFCSQVVLETLGKLGRTCKDVVSLHPFIRPLMLTLGELVEVLLALSEQKVSLFSFKIELDLIAGFLERSRNTSRHLEFALDAHFDKEAVELFFVGVENILTTLSKAPYRAVDEVVLRRWRTEAKAFGASCREVWELHLYLVFVDVKGDLALFEQTVKRLCRHLECTVSSLVVKLTNTTPYVERAFRDLANREHGALLLSLHADSLRQWRESWGEFLTKQEPQSHTFWEIYFTYLYKITWPDFFEAFEHFFFHGRCPQDIVTLLRLKVDHGLDHQVSRNTWQRILETHRRIWDFVDVLLEDVLEHLSNYIYRAEPLMRLVRSPAKLENIPEDESDFMERRGKASSSASKSKKFVGFVDDGPNMAIPTPNDVRFQHVPFDDDAPGSNGMSCKRTMTWDELVSQRCSQETSCWWMPPHKLPPIDEVAAGLDGGQEPLRVAALRAVNGSIAYTNKALVFRIVSGDLAKSMPILESALTPSVHSNSSASTPIRTGSEGADRGCATPPALPALVISPNGTRLTSVTKFGRSSSRRTLMPDFPMSEPIASRSHFNVLYDQDVDGFFLMDAGSKWGTFVKIGAGSSITLCCGDWIRVGGVEFIVRYCGGGCNCLRRHAHYRLHSFRLLRDHQKDRQTRSVDVCTSTSSNNQGCLEAVERPSPMTCRKSQSFGQIKETWDVCAHRNDFRKHSASVPCLSQLAKGCGEQEESSSEDEIDATEMDQLLLLLSSRTPKGWISSSARICNKTALRNAGALSDSSACTEGDINASGCKMVKQRNINSGSGAGKVSIQVPIAPLELDFISGPRMGEKLVVNERFCTLGRGEGNTIQVSDSQLASVSRVHCIFEYVGNRWTLRDNDSTNGTWRRLSCVLEPSKRLLLSAGVCIQAGVHEFKVEEAEMRYWWLPTASSAVISELLEQERNPKSRERNRPPPPYAANLLET